MIICGCVRLASVTGANVLRFEVNATITHFKSQFEHTSFQATRFVFILILPTSVNFNVFPVK